MRRNEKISIQEKTVSSGDINYMENLALKPVAEKVKRVILALGPSIHSIQRQNFIVFDYTNSSMPGISRIAAIRYYRKNFRVHAHQIDKSGHLDPYEPYPYTECNNGDEDFSPIVSIIKTSYKNLGGSVKSS